MIDFILVLLLTSPLGVVLALGIISLLAATFWVRKLRLGMDLSLRVKTGLIGFITQAMRRSVFIDELFHSLIPLVGICFVGMFTFGYITEQLDPPGVYQVVMTGDLMVAFYAAVFIIGAMLRIIHATRWWEPTFQQDPNTMVRTFV